MTTTESNKRIVLLTAGLGARLGILTEKRNKALISIKNKAIISYIIDRLPKDAPIVVALGYYGDRVKQFLEIAYPERKFYFQFIDPYKGPGSSSGVSLLQLKPYLPGPFIFCTNDTIVMEDVEFEGRNWVGVARSDDIDRYTTFSLYGDKITKVCRKGESGGDVAYIGLAEINNYQDFWKSLEGGLRKNPEASDIEGLYGLLENNLFPKNFTWFDTGTKEKYDEVVKFFGKGGFTLPKENEDLFLVGKSVIKFFADSEKCGQRIERAKILKGLVPDIEAFSSNLYCYKWVSGRTFFEAVTPENLKLCLEWAEKNLWIKKEIDKKIFTEMNKEFYSNKTLSRLEKLFEKGWIADGEYIINGEKCRKPKEVIDLLPESFYESGVPCRIHGDFCSENIVVTHDNKFVLLDWRQDFAGNLEVGDLYYDLAKLYHGLIVSDEYIKTDLYRTEIKGSSVKLDFALHYQNRECIRLLEKWVFDHKLSVERLRTITALVYLSMSPLHHYPYNQFLFFLGTQLLNRVIKREGDQDFRFI
ncbi:MAG: phosphotransferase [Patescibacteria group bacterium]